MARGTQDRSPAPTYERIAQVPGHRGRRGSWVTHTDLAVLAVAATGGGNHAFRVALGSMHHGVVRIAQAFLDVQVARERAGYDDTFDVPMVAALAFVDLARDAVSMSVALSDAGDPTCSQFLALAMGRSKSSGTGDAMTSSLRSTVPPPAALNPVHRCFLSATPRILPSKRIPRCDEPRA